jgi:hypothetical protein
MIRPSWRGSDLAGFIRRASSMGLHRPFLGGLACVRLYARRKRNRSAQVHSCTKLHDCIRSRCLLNFIRLVIANIVLILAKQPANSPPGWPRITKFQSAGCCRIHLWCGRRERSRSESAYPCIKLHDWNALTSCRELRPSIIIDSICTKISQAGLPVTARTHQFRPDHSIRTVIA